MKKTTIETIPAGSLVLDFQVYPRHQVSETHVRDLARALEAGATLPPVIGERKTRRVVDGFHRTRAALKVSEQAEIEVSWRDYAGEKELLLDAIRLNSGHGQKLTPYDMARCVVLADEFKFEPAELASALSLTVERVEKLRVSKTAQDSDHKVTAIKRTLYPFRGRRLSRRQMTGNEKASGHSALFLVFQVVNLIENDLIDRGDEKLAAALERLGGLLSTRQIAV